MLNSTEFTAEQNFELRRQELVLSQASKDQLIELYLKLLQLHYRYLNCVRTMLAEKLQGERSGRAL